MTNRLLQSLGGDLLEAAGRNIFSKATPFLSNKILDASSYFNKYGYDTSNVVDKSINYFTKNQDKLKQIALNAIMKDSNINLNKKSENKKKVFGGFENFPHSNKMTRPQNSNAQFGDTSWNGYKTPDSSIFRNTTKRMPIELFLPDSTPYVIGDESVKKPTKSVKLPMKKSLYPTTPFEEPLKENYKQMIDKIDKKNLFEKKKKEFMSKSRGLKINMPKQENKFKVEL